MDPMTATGAAPEKKKPGRKALLRPKTVEPVAVPGFRTDVTKEYVAAGSYGWTVSNFVRTLPPYIDDITQDFGDDLYERMLLDSKVAQAFNFIKLAVLADGIQWLPAVQDKTDEDYEKSQEVLEFVKRSVHRLDAPLGDTLFELLDAMGFGYKVAETVYELVKDETDEDFGRLVLKSLKVKPRKSTAFIVDAFMNVVALAGLLPGVSSLASTQGVMSLDQLMRMSSTVFNILPRDKFLVYSFRTKNRDPRGSSLLRPAYHAWWMKQQIWPEYMKYLSQFAGPSLVGYTAPEAEPYYEQDADGNVVTDPVTGLPVSISPEQLMVNTLTKYRNGGSMAFPYGSKVEPVKVPDNGSSFIDAIELFNKEILQGIQYQTLATGESKHQARAAASTHQDVLDMIIKHGKETVCHAFRRDVLYRLVEFNYGSDVARRLTPHMSLAKVEQHDFASTATAVASLFSSGFLDISQAPEVDAMLGLPVRNLDEIQARKEEEQAQALALAKASRPDPQPQDQQPQPADQPVRGGKQPGAEQNQGSAPRQGKQQTGAAKGGGNRPGPQKPSKEAN